MRVGSFFSGIGGIELGLERAGGFETVWFVEKNPYARAVLRRHWPAATIYEDVTRLDFGSVPGIDVLTGGFPCQDISNAGKRAGIQGDRSRLWKDFLRAVSVLRPKLIIAENVAAIIGRGLDTVLCDLASIGYDAEWYCIPAASVGAPHRRDRIVILAYPNGERGQERTHEEGGERWVEQAQFDFGQGSGNMAYTQSERCGKAGTSGERSEEWIASSSAMGDAECQRSSEPREHEQSFSNQTCADGEADRIVYAGWWAVEPDLGRVADGIPFRVDRLRCLGNAVVPQWAEAIGRAINAAEKEK